eukprot:3428875-Pyramimonas_sp.AAC.1
MMRIGIISVSNRSLQNLAGVTTQPSPAPHPREADPFRWILTLALYNNFGHSHLVTAPPAHLGLLILGHSSAPYNNFGHSPLVTVPPLRWRISAYSLSVTPLRRTLVTLPSSPLCSALPVVRPRISASFSVTPRRARPGAPPAVGLPRRCPHRWPLRRRSARRGTGIPGSGTCSQAPPPPWTPAHEWSAHEVQSEVILRVML